MTRNDLVDRCKQLIEEAYQDATEMIVAYLEIHPNEPRLPLCKEIDAEGWTALEGRVRRLQEKRRSEGIVSSISILEAQERQAKARARHVLKDVDTLRDPEIQERIAEIAANDPEIRDRVERQIAADPESTARVVTKAAAARPPAPTQPLGQRAQPRTPEAIETVTRLVSDLADPVGAAAVEVSKDETLRGWASETAKRLALYAEVLSPETVSTELDL